MLKSILLISALFIITPLAAETTCDDDESCVVVKNTSLQCNKSSSTQYLSDCVANIVYQPPADLTTDNVAVGCEVALNYLKSVMGIRDSVRQRDSQIIELAAHGSDTFEMPVTFNFATQTEANNAEIKAVSCQIDSTQP